jgi:hypothetical protein
MRPPLRRALRSLRYLAPAFALLLLCLGRAVPAGTDAQPPAPPTTKAPTPTDPNAKPQQVTVGLYLQNVPEIDIKTNSFSAEFYLWFLWGGDLDPTLTYEFTNVVNVSELTKIPIFVDASGASAPELLPDGRHLQQFHVYGRFGHPFPLARYPFDDHEIVISLEDARSSTDALVHVLDQKGTTMRPDLVIPGWDLHPMTTAVGTHRFSSNFGDPRTGRNEDVYSHVDFMMKIERPWVGIVSKTIIPIALIILITFGAFFLQPADIDARLCLTITALISAVALQFTAATELPPTGSLLLLDKIYILSYLAILSVTFASIASNRFVHAEKPKSAAFTDRAGLWFTATAYFGALAFFVLRAR